MQPEPAPPHKGEFTNWPVKIKKKCVMAAGQPFIKLEPVRYIERLRCR